MPSEDLRARLDLPLRAVAALGSGFLVLALGLAILIGAPLSAGAQDSGPKSGLPVPRFVSLKSDRVNVRQGPTRDHAVAWIFTRQGLPVEITAEYDNWRRVRDTDGQEGWVFHSMLSGRRTALVAPWARDALLDLHRRPDPESPVIARLEPKVLADVAECTGAWCRVKVGSVSGHIRQDSLWGVYPKEEVE